MSSIENRIQNIRQSIMKHAVAMKEKAKKQGFEFKPFSVKQKKVLTWWCESSPVKNKEGIIADGAIRSGKTLCMSLSYVLWAMSTFNQQNFGMAGKTIGSFRRNVLFWLKLMLKSRGYTVVDHRSDNLIVVSKGNVQNFFYIFGGKDERSQDLIQGITLAGMFFDEVALPINHLSPFRFATMTYSPALASSATVSSHVTGTCVMKRVQSSLR